MNGRLSVLSLFIAVLVLAALGPILAGEAALAGSLDEDLFTATGIELPDIWQGDLAWGDYDGDSDLDIVLTSGYETSEIFRNDGGNVFTDIDAGLETVNGGSVAWGDYDNDSDLDLLLVGGDNFNIEISRIYRNEGNHAFSDINAQLIGVWSFPVTVWGDYDNDGDLDIFLSGNARGNNPITRIYRNEGQGVFSDIKAAALTDIAVDAMAWGDYDGDDDLDILCSGWLLSGGRATRIYRNEGHGHFSDIGAALEDVNQGAVEWGDYDNDGDPDILLAGWSDRFEIAKIYRNDGGDSFTDTEAPLTGVARSPSASWGDFDNDGDLDILLAGCVYWDDDFGFCNKSVTQVFRNDGDDLFSFLDVTLPHPWEEPVAWGDYDNDGKLDLLIAAEEVTTIYRNNSPIANTRPAAPGALGSLVSGGAIRFTWDAGSDAQTSSPGLSYNLRVGTTPGGTEVVSPMANADASLQLPQIGNAGYGLSAALQNLPAGTYYWSVQAVDTAFAASLFAEEQQFTLWKLYFPVLPIQP